ncbi:hypothetical protein GMLC_07930 [Geomonas limicola]|uniref:Uncharacterized protein n=2 Tax=Geomonas limicola TaxID=2740186 RepID=A0A6V8N5J9_9BACT|nr:hypothetical protein GMLC_07930 [Geomonas limicola]
MLFAWLLTLALWFSFSASAYGYIIINAPMTDSNAAGWTLGGNPTTARLTGTGNTAGGDDAAGSGWLRLTNSSTNQTGYAYNATTFDLSAGLLVQFDYATWGGSGADGYSVFLFDAGVPAFNIGAFGGSLGYAQKLPPTVNPAVPGISGGYIGVGVDEFGNFASGSEGRYLGPGQTPNTMTVRGSVSGFGGGATGATSGSTSYPWIATSPNNGSLWYNGTTRPDQVSSNYRKVIISISPAPNPVLSAWIQFGYNTTPVQMISNQALPAISASQQLQVGFGASTGASTNYHEIRNLLITTQNQSTSIDLGVTKTAVTTGTSTAITSALVGSTFQYQLNVRNYGPNAITATGVGVVDTMPSYLTPGSWTCSVLSGSPAGTSCGAASGTGNLNSTANLPRNGGVLYTLNATVNAAPPGGQLTNTATLVKPGAVIDYYPNNDSASSTITVYAPPVATKTFTPASVPRGSTSVLTVTLTNPNNVAATGVAFTDSYPTNLVNTATASRATTCGGTVTAANSGTSLKLTGGTIPANGSCTVTVNTTSNTAGSYVNSTGSITTTNIGTGAAASGTLVAMAPPTITKTFTPSQIGVNGTSVATITITNPNAAPITGAAFSDTYVAGLLNTANASESTTCTGGTVTAADGGNSLALSGATIPANGSCTVTVNVTSAAAGSYIDPSGTVTTANAGTGSSASATLTVLQPPAVSASYTPTTVLPGVGGVYQVTLTNPNSSAITGATFTDTYTAGLVNAATAAASTTCTGGTVAAAGGGNSLTLSGATIPANGSCTVTVTTTSASAGVYANSTGPVATSNAGTGTAASATLAVMAPPTAALLFTPSSIGIGGVSQLKVTLSNPNTVAITGAAFTDSYPANLVNTASASAATTCGSTVTAANNGSSLAISGGTIPAGGSCTVTVNVTVTATGAFTDSTGPISSTNAGTGQAATASLNGPQPPTVALAFTPASIVLGGSSQLSVTLTNPNAVAVTGVAFTDSYPAGLVNAASASGSTTCGGTLTAANGGNSLALAGATIPANGSCTVTVNVTPTAAGNYTDATGTVSTGNAGSAAAASGTLLVMAPPTVTMAFSPASELVNSTAQLSITLSNPNTSTAITGVSFTDSYPAGLVNTASAGASTSCTGGTVTATNGGSSLALTGASIPAGGSCTVTVNVTSSTAGSYLNSTGAVATTNAGNAAAASATLTTTRLSAPTVTKAFSPAQIPVNSTALQTITLTNTSATTVTGVSFTDSYPTGLVNAAAAGATTSCPGGTATAANGGNSLTLSGASIPASSSCTVTVNVTSASAGSYLNTTGTLVSGNAENAAAASATLVVLSAPSVTLGFTPSSVVVNTPSLLTVTLTNPNATAITGAAFTDNYPAGLVNVTPAAASTTCSGATLTAADGDDLLTLSGATIPANGSCTVTVKVTSATAGSYLDSTGTLTTSNAGSAAAASATLTTTLLPAPTVQKSFTPNQVVVNGTTTLSITLTNPSTTAITGVAFTDSFPTSPGQMVVATGATISNGCGGTAVIAANRFSFSITAASIPASGSCTISVGVSAPSIGTYTNTTSTVTSANAVTSATASGVLTVAPMTSPSAVVTFTPNQIGVNGSSVLKVTLANTNSVAITGAAFTDSYPAGLLNAASAGASTTCSGGTVVAPDNGSSLALSGASIPANGSCTVTVTVTAATAGSYLDSTGTITTGNAGTGSAASATLNVLQAPSASLSFTPAMILLSNTAQLVVTLSNPNSIAITGAGFSDSYPSGLTNTSSASGSTTCISGSVSAANGGSLLALSGATIPGNGSCTVTVNVTSASAGSYLDSTGVISTGNAGAGSAASATLIVTPAPVLCVSKTVTPSVAAPGQLVTYSDLISNPSSGYAISVVLTDVVSPYAYWSLNAYGTGVLFQFSEGTPASGLTLGTPVYSKDGGATWSYLPSSGAGGAPAGYDGLVTNWKIPMTGTMNPSGARFTINYKVLLR